MYFWPSSFCPFWLQLISVQSFLAAIASFAHSRVVGGDLSTWQILKEFRLQNFQQQLSPCSLMISSMICLMASHP